jgi:hypothetical protein
VVARELVGGGIATCRKVIDQFWFLEGSGFARFGVDEFSGVCEDGGFEAKLELESGGGDSDGGRRGGGGRGRVRHGARVVLV